MSTSPLHNADWSKMSPVSTEPNPLVEKVSMWLCLMGLLAGCAGWYGMVVRPHDEKMRNMIACVGDRAPTREVLASCEK